MSRTVLCVIELDNYPEDVVARAAWLAKLYDCDLELVLNEPVVSYLGESFVYFAEMQLVADGVRNEQEAVLQRLALVAEDAGVKVNSSTSNERPEADMIAAKAEACDALFVVKGTHYHSPSERASLAHTDWQLIRDLQRPLWFVKPTAWKEPPVIVAAVDPTHRQDQEAALDRKIIQSGQAIAGKCDGKVVVIHTYQRLEEIGTRATWNFMHKKLPVDDLDEKIKAEHQKALDTLADECGVPGEDVHQLPGRTHELLPTFARGSGASLVVMGALARSGLKKRVVSRTAARVLDHLPCDVLIVHV